MQNQKRLNRALIIIFVILLLMISVWWGKNPLWISMGMISVAILFFLSRFESRRVEARELVIIAVLAAIAAVGRLPFASLPNVQPTTFVIMISGLVFGAETGFMVGAVAAFASNMLIGQGPWTPWQVTAWGLVGYTAGLLAKTKWMQTLWGRITFGVIWGFLFGWIMNIWGLLGFSQSGIVVDLKGILAYYLGSVLFDSMHSISNVLFLVIFGNAWIKNLTRIKDKYGLLD